MGASSLQPQYYIAFWSQSGLQISGHHFSVDSSICSCSSINCSIFLLEIYMCISITFWAGHLVFGRFFSLTEIAFVIFHPRNSSFSLMKKFAQLLPATDNQFINISNPDPFTLLKLISTKYVFPKSCSQIPIPIQFFCQPNFIESHKFNRSFHLEKGQQKSPPTIQSSVDDKTEWMAIFCIWNPDFLSHWSRSL